MTRAPSRDGNAKRSKAARAKRPGDYFQAKARVSWGGAMPEWVLKLAAELDRRGLGRGLGKYSASAISYVISNTYTGRLDLVEMEVRGKLMGGTVECPVVGPLATDQCLGHQREPWAPHNPQRVAFARACINCPNRVNLHA